jgi:hypothetical protein
MEIMKRNTSVRTNEVTREINNHVSLIQITLFMQRQLTFKVKTDVATDTYSNPFTHCNF